MPAQVIVGIPDPARLQRVVEFLEATGRVDIVAACHNMTELREAAETCDPHGLIMWATDHDSFRTGLTWLTEGRPLPALGFLESDGHATAQIWDWIHHARALVCPGHLLDRRDAGAATHVAGLIEQFATAAAPARVLSRSTMDLDDLDGSLDDIL